MPRRLSTIVLQFSLEKKMLTEVPRTLPLIDFKRIKRCLCFQNVMENIHFCYLCTEKHSRIRLFS